MWDARSTGMRATSFFATCIFVGVSGMTSLASAEGSRLTAIRQNLHELDTRAKAIQQHVDRSPASLKRTAGQVIAGVRSDCQMVSTRLAITHLLGDGYEEGRPVDEMEATIESVGRRMSMLERWYSLR
jgi:hypothetical protein